MIQLLPAEMVMFITRNGVLANRESKFNATGDRRKTGNRVVWFTHSSFYHRLPTWSQWTLTVMIWQMRFKKPSE